ncbi:hypothetical protein MtrunA17_Chr2g0314581 [Medicago truncatula]|uniref:Uncharacterized protein n=1 Tax=Medicago truncatula TaxID=3880 RepID=B7FG72_MEDTR|nr:unknown [Medicago truncatula]RHN74832.1 hypothetical protein MtrunA17_Chr2g0314581 [Medicago truncatula]
MTKTNNTCLSKNELKNASLNVREADLEHHQQKVKHIYRIFEVLLDCNFWLLSRMQQLLHQ